MERVGPGSPTSGWPWRPTCQFSRLSFKQEPDFDFSLPKLREVSVRRRYSEFKWLRDEVKTINTIQNYVTTHFYALLTFSDSPDLQYVQVTRTVQINVPNLPGKALTKQLPFLKNDDGENFNNCSQVFILCCCRYFWGGVHWGTQGGPWGNFKCFGVKTIL